MGGRTLQRDVVYMVKAEEWALERAGEWREGARNQPQFSISQCPLPTFFLTPGPLPIHYTIHSPTISAPMNRLRRTLTSQNQRCKNRQQVKPGCCSSRVPKTSHDCMSPKSLVALLLSHTLSPVTFLMF